MTTTLDRPTVSHETTADAPEPAPAPATVADRLRETADALGIDPAFVFVLDKLETERFAAMHYAASRDEARPVLTGIELKHERGAGTLAATDSYRLALRTYRTMGEDDETSAGVYRLDDATEPASFIVPAREMSESLRNAGKLPDIKGHRGMSFGRVAVFVPRADSVAAYQASATVAVVFPDGALLERAGYRRDIRGIDGTYPGWERLLTSGTEWSAATGRDGGAAAVTPEWIEHEGGPGHYAAWNVGMLADLARIAGPEGKGKPGKQGTPIRIRQLHALKPTLFAIPGEDDRSSLDVLMMPVRL